MRTRPLALTVECDLPIERYIDKTSLYPRLRNHSCLPATSTIQTLEEKSFDSLCFYSRICRLGSLMNFLHSELNALNKGATS